MLAPPNVSDESRAQAEEIATRGLRLEPFDARLYALAGFAKEDQKAATTQAYYQHALRLLPIERLALIQRLVHHIDNGQPKESVDLLEMFFVRWRDQWSAMAPLIPAIATDETAYDALVERFVTRPGGLYGLVTPLAREAQTLPVAERLVRDAYRRSGVNVRRSANYTVEKLFAAGEPRRAYFLFLQTLSDVEKEEAGYVYNGSFDLVPNRNRFDWTMRNQGGTNVRRVSRSVPADDPSQAKLANSAEISFLNTPVNFRGLSQYLYLPPGPFELSLTHSTRGFKSPKPFTLEVRCVQGTRRISSVEIQQGDAREKTVTTAFSVPVRNCGLQQITFRTDPIVESWRNRFSGTVLVHDVSLRLVTQQ